MYGNQLQLIGPYKAISAEGSFAIQAYGITSGSGTDTSDKSGKEVMGEMLWDGYTDNVEYDKFLTGEIPISTGTGQHTIAKVGYAVWSDAVEATVEVNLLLTRIRRVHGWISARYGSSYKNEVMLFRLPWDEKVELVPSAADSMVPLELRRSVIAVSLLSRYSRVTMWVVLKIATPNNESDLNLAGVIYFYLDKHTGEIRMEQRGDSFLPMGSTGTSDAIGGGATSSASGQGTEQNIAQQAKVQVNITSPGFHLTPLQPDDDWYSRVM
jgi:hypothetical protein